jgi:hypothetical protein
VWIATNYDPIKDVAASSPCSPRPGFARPVKVDAPRPSSRATTARRSLRGETSGSLARGVVPFSRRL